MKGNAPDESSDGVDASDAISYAVSGDLVVLYGVLVVGWVIRTMGAAISAGSSHDVTRGAQLLIGGSVSLLGSIVLGLGVVALAYKVVGDAPST